ncbi:conjugative transposon protein TraM [Pedobacter suwonensis]|uniref:conjugative transposon protein TraM n=1 Tax=Pedobacter suwonensis TaxID=332999 RepID=UPI001356583D|nr:conjugative transposon protein TraM [Pedobacter suwonensis]
MFLPLLVVPLLLFGFYLLQKQKENGAPLTSTKGINTQLPDASFSADTPKTKADYYAQADRDQKKNEQGIAGIAGQLGFDVDRSSTSVNGHEQTQQINAKLEALNREINRPEPSFGKPANQPKSQPTSMKSDVERLETLMKTMQDNKADDPEMAQLNGMMQSILDIQHPERVAERQRSARSLSPDSLFRATPAVLVDNQKAVQGATIKLRLQDSLSIGNMVIPKGHIIFGACRIANQRLLIDISNIRLGTSIIPVDLSVYSLDGMIGITAPEAALTGALNDGTDNAVRSVGFGFDQSVATQVASAGIDAARQLISRKVKKIKVKLKSGYSILLRNNQNRAR